MKRRQNPNRRVVVKKTKPWGPRSIAVKEPDNSDRWSVKRGHYKAAILAEPELNERYQKADWRSHALRGPILTSLFVVAIVLVVIFG